MREIATHPVVLILMMLAVYRFSLFLRLRSGSPLANPLMVSTVLVISYLKLFGIRYDDFMPRRSWWAAWWGL